jgi:hypothetical protein
VVHPPSPSIKKKEPEAVSIACGSGQETIVSTTPSADRLPPTRLDPIDVARRVNVGVAVELEAQRRRAAYQERSRDCDCDSRFEALEAALFAVWKVADEAEDLARFALERLDAE